MRSRAANCCCSKAFDFMYFMRKITPWCAYPFGSSSSASKARVAKKKNLEELRVAKKKKLEELRAVLQTFLENRASALGVSARKVAAKLVRSCYVILVRPTVPKHTITFLHTLGRISCKLQVVCITCNLHVIHVKNFSLHVRARSRLYRSQICKKICVGIRIYLESSR